jgi:hypothetical protein
MGLCPENPDDVGVDTEPTGEDSRETDEEWSRSMKEAVEESRSFDGTFDCDPVVGIGCDWRR